MHNGRGGICGFRLSVKASYAFCYLFTMLAGSVEPTNTALELIGAVTRAYKLREYLGVAYECMDIAVNVPLPGTLYSAL